ncbi:Thymic stromal lymphopoietin [Galemys pyrenaicus]|uniref:Thymic stromal lymphopoietin n=1 Tax=Galemys pyrenaicus TaxID=202257 RepID=A0A8J5ZQJ2_GALPY|nr:Thymic stromal lymphopoietin [Galemys pyrenaicus]
MYQNVFFPALKNYMNGMTSTDFDHLECKDQRNAGLPGSGVLRCRAPGGGWAPRRYGPRKDEPAVGSRLPKTSARPDCLAQIERVTFTPTHGCLSLAKETFAVGTKTTFILKCPGYSGMQMNKTQATKKRNRREVPTNECLEQVSNLLELWRHFSRFPRKQYKS